MIIHLVFVSIPVTSQTLIDVAYIAIDKTLVPALIELALCGGMDRFANCNEHSREKMQCCERTELVVPN